MTSIKNRINKTLGLRQAEFGGFVKWKNFFLKRHGHLIFGICLDRFRYPSCYISTFFIHDLLRGGINLMPTYSTVATKSDIKTALKFESDIADAVRPLRQNAPILGKKTLPFDDFLSHLFC